MRLEFHAEERVQAFADGLAEAVGGVEREHFGRLGQFLPDALQPVAEDGERAGQDVLVEVARAHEHAIAAGHEVAQHQHGGLVQVLQFVEQHGVVAALQPGVWIAEVQFAELPGDFVGAVARGVELRFVVRPPAQAFVPAQQQVEPVVQRVVPAVGGGVGAFASDVAVQEALLGQGLEAGEGLHVELAGQEAGGLGRCLVPQFLQQRGVGLADQQLALQRLGQCVHRQALRFQQPGAELLHRHDPHLARVGRHVAAQPVAEGGEARVGVGQHEHPARAVHLDQVRRLGRQGGGLARARQGVDEHRLRRGVEDGLLLVVRAALDEGGGGGGGLGHWNQCRRPAGPQESDVK